MEFVREYNELSMKARIQFIELPLRGPQAGGGISRALRHPFFAWAGFRQSIAQHTLAEHEALMRHARSCRTVVEIGVAEGASAVGLREAMHPDATLYLIDPFHLSRMSALNCLKRAAHRAVNTAGSARTIWIESFSHDAVRTWRLPIDFLLIDGDHREQAVERDWLDWSPYLTARGVVAFHDARLFANGWTSPEYGPVKFVERFFRQHFDDPWSIIEEVDSLVFVSRRRLS
jgi:predicted O-methyltransferase YrrM